MGPHATSNTLAPNLRLPMQLAAPALFSTASLAHTLIHSFKHLLTDSIIQGTAPSTGE